MAEISYEEFRSNLKKPSGFRPENYHWDSQGHKNCDDHLYFISNGNGHLKIGRSKDVKKRITSMQTSNHTKLGVIFIAEQKGFLESILHSCFSEERVMGEWFNDCDRIRKFIDYVNFHPKISKIDLSTNEWVSEFTFKEISDLSVKFNEIGSDKMLLGKYKGFPLRTVPIDYMIWFSKNAKTNKEIASYFCEFLRRHYEENT